VKDTNFYTTAKILDLRYRIVIFHAIWMCFFLWINCVENFQLYVYRFPLSYTVSEINLTEEFFLFYPLLENDHVDELLMGHNFF